VLVERPTGSVAGRRREVGLVGLVGRLRPVGLVGVGRPIALRILEVDEAVLVVVDRVRAGGEVGVQRWQVTTVGQIDRDAGAADAEHRVGLGADDPGSTDRAENAQREGD